MEPTVDSPPEDPRGDFFTARYVWSTTINGSVPQLDAGVDMLDALQAQLDALTARVDGMTTIWTGLAERLDGIDRALEELREFVGEADLYRAWTGRRS